MRPAILATLIVFLACEPIATPEYQGEPIGRLRGTISSEISPPPAAAEMVLLWINWRSEPGSVLGTRSEVNGTFPSGFDVTLYLPPPVDGLNILPQRSPDKAEPRLGFAWIVVMREGATPPGGKTITHADVKGLRPGDVLGWAEDYVLAYLDASAPAGSFAAEILSGPMEPGFHLMRADGRGGTDLEAIRTCKANGGRSDVCTPNIEGLTPAEQGLDTEVDVRLTTQLNALRVPIFSLPAAVEDAYGL